MSRHAIPIWWTFGSGVLFSAGREFFGCSASSRTSCFELPKDFSANLIWRQADPENQSVRQAAWLWQPQLGTSHRGRFQETSALSRIFLGHSTVNELLRSFDGS